LCQTETEREGWDGVRDVTHKPRPIGLVYSGVAVGVAEEDVGGDVADHICLICSQKPVKCSVMIVGEFERWFCGLRCLMKWIDARGIEEA